MALALAVYASQDELPRLHARLATGGWSPSPGRTCTCWLTTEGFKECLLHPFPPSPGFAWRNVRCISLLCGSFAPQELLPHCEASPGQLSSVPLGAAGEDDQGGVIVKPALPLARILSGERRLCSSCGLPRELKVLGHVADVAAEAQLVGAFEELVEGRTALRRDPVA